VARISVIMPVYNAQSTVMRALQSLLAQSFADWECICVDDGSTDGSGELLDEVARGDSRIRVTHQANAGVSAARNAALSRVSGAYVTFLDADDEFEPSAFARMIEALGASLADGASLDTCPWDALAFGARCVPAGSESAWFQAHAVPRDVEYAEFTPALLFAENTIPRLQVLFRASLLEDSAIRFDPSLSMGEDLAFLCALYARAHGAKLVSSQVYIYRVDSQGSAMQRAAADVRDKIDRDLDALCAVFADWQSAGFFPRYASALVEWSVAFIEYSILRQEPQWRASRLVRLRDAWRGALPGDDALRGIASHAVPMVRLCLDCSNDGVLAVGESKASRIALAWRLKHYGVGDIAAKVVGKLHR